MRQPLGKTNIGYQILSAAAEPVGELAPLDHLKMMAMDAAQASLWGRKDAYESWYAVTQKCRELNFPFDRILAMPHPSGHSLGAIVFTSKDFRSCLVLHGNLPDGLYLHGALKRSEYQILYSPDASIRALGVRLNQDGSVYKGEFLDEQPDGDGTLDTYRGVTYTGEFRKGAITGWGHSVSTWPRKAEEEGIFIDGAYIGNPRIPQQHNAGRSNFFNQCRKLMGMKS